MENNEFILKYNDTVEGKFDEYFIGDHLSKEISWASFNLKNFMKEQINKKNLSRIDIMIQMASNRRYPGWISKIKIRTQEWLVGFLQRFPELFKYLINDIRMLIPKTLLNYYDIRIRIERAKNNIFYLVILLQIKKNILSNLCELEHVYQQVENTTKILEMSQVTKIILSEDEFPMLTKVTTYK